MERSDEQEANGDALELGRRIAEWRRERPKQGPMPEELWAAAVGIAVDRGVSTTAREIGVDFGALKKRVDRYNRARRGGGDGCGGFVEVPVAPFLASGDGACGSAVLELVSAGGSRLVMHLPSGAGVDLLAVAAAFWRDAP